MLLDLVAVLSQTLDLIPLWGVMGKRFSAIYL